MAVEGIDVSDYQGPAPDLSGAQFVMIKATEGTTFVSAQQVAQAEHARAAGLPVGWYHFLWPGDIEAQAQWFVTKCASVVGDSLWIDWETTEDGTHATAAEKDQMLAAVKALRPDHRVGLYCNLTFWKTIDTTSDCGDGLWIADPGSPAGHPAVEHAWTVHQYGSSDNLDRDVADFPTAAAMRSWAAPVQPQYQPFPGADWFTMGRVSPIVGRMHQRLIAVGCNRYKSTLDQDVIGTGDITSYEAWQRKCGFVGAAATWPPGQDSWDRLQVPSS